MYIVDSVLEMLLTLFKGSDVVGSNEVDMYACFTLDIVKPPFIQTTKTIPIITNTAITAIIIPALLFWVADTLVQTGCFAEVVFADTALAVAGEASAGTDLAVEVADVAGIAQVVAVVDYTGLVVVDLIMDCHNLHKTLHYHHYVYRI